MEDVDYRSHYSILPKEQMMVGEDAKEHLSKVSSETRAMFYGTVRSFLTTAVTYIMKHRKVTENYLRLDEVADISNRENAHWSSLSIS